MPSFLIPQGNEFFDQWVADALAVTRSARITARSPWQGIVPDLDPYRISSTAMSVASFGLVARPGPDEIGEVLMTDAGFSEIDGGPSGRLPITTGSGSNTNVTMIAEFNRTTAAGAKASGTEYVGPTMLALVGGDNTQGTTELWRLRPSDGQWEEVTFETSTGGPPASSLSPGAGREFLSDWAEFPAGAPARTAYSAQIDEPVFVWCNLQDKVMVYPNDNTSTENAQFEPLTDRFSADFRAQTVEHFGGRLYFGNTIEASTQHRQRIRRTALFTADPLETSPGAGAFDIRDFSGDLLRLEKLGDLMAAYFEDGVAFIRLSGIATSPDAVQLLREKRGLLGTHAMTSVGNQEHFGIFDDGWFFLDPSGRWTEIGMMNIDGVQTSKWKDYFYDNVDKDFRHRVVVAYDGRFIRIAWTKNATADPDNQEVWIFDPRGNRVFRDAYPVTVWGINSINVQAATLWSDSGFGTWSGEATTWSSHAAKFGLKNLTHGTTSGHLVIHNYDSFTQFNTANSLDENPPFLLEGVMSSGGDPTILKTAIKLWMEHIHTGSDSVTFTISGDSTEGSVSKSIAIGGSGTPGDVETVFATFNFTAANLRYSIAGTAPIRIRSILADITSSSSEERRG